MNEVLMIYIFDEDERSSHTRHDYFNTTKQDHIDSESLSFRQEINLHLHLLN